MLDLLVKYWALLAGPAAFFGGWFTNHMGWIRSRKDKTYDRTNEEEDKLVALLKESLAQTREENEKLKERLDSLQLEFHVMNTQLTSIKDLLSAATGSRPESLSISRIRALFATRDNNIKPMISVVQRLGSAAFVKRYLPPAFEGKQADWEMVAVSRLYDELYLRGAKYEGRTDHAIWEKTIADNYANSDEIALKSNGPINVVETANSDITGTQGKWVGTKETFIIDGDVFMFGHGVHVFPDGTVKGQMLLNFEDKNEATSI